jgi:hypothetical protein
MPQDMVGGYLRHQFVALVEPLFAVESERKGDRIGEIFGIGGA